MISSNEIHQARPLRADVLVRDQNGWPVAIVEVKNRPGLSSEDAASIRRNMLVHGLASQDVPFFLVVSQDSGYLWNQLPRQFPDEAAPVEFPMQPVLSHYVRWLVPGGRISGSSLEFVVANWLTDLSIDNGPALREIRDQLAPTGFLEAVEGATVTLNERT